MRNITGIIAAALAMAMAGGCASQAPKQATGMASGSVLDVTPVRPAKPAYAAGPQYVTPPDEPVAAPIVTPAYASTPDASAAKPVHKAHSDDSVVGGKYKVKHGDTLYHIAKAKYGDGKKWTEIASANPGLSPQTLKVGQTIIVP